MKKLIPFLAVAVIAGLAGRAFHVAHADPVAPLRTDAMIEALKDSGWTVVEAEKFGQMEWAIADLETDTSTLKAKVRELVAAAKSHGAEVRAVAEFSAETETALNLPAEVHGSDSLPEPKYLTLPKPDSVTASFTDGVFSGRIAYFPHPETFNLMLRAQIAAALAITDGGDGRTLFSVVPRDPRVKINLDRALYSPPEPVKVCGWGERIRWAVGGVSLGMATSLAR